MDRGGGQPVLAAPPPAWVGFCSGAVAGLSRVAIGHPFDTAKVRVQTGGTMLSEMSLRGVASLYRGVVPPLLSVGMTTCINFGIYENAKAALATGPWNGRFESPQRRFALEFCAGTTAGGLISSATAPLENAKVIQQTSDERRSLLGWMRKLYSTRGMRGLYRAMAPHFIQAGFGRGFYLGTFHLVKEIEDGHMLRSNAAPRPANQPAMSSTLFGKVIAGASAGVAGWSFTYPFDVIRSNMMRDWKCEAHRTTMGCLRSLVRRGGIAQLYAGMGFTIARAIPVASVTLPTYDYTRAFLLRVASEDN